MAEVGGGRGSALDRDPLRVAAPLRRAREAPHRAVGPRHRPVDARARADRGARLPLDRAAAARRPGDVCRRRLQRRPREGQRRGRQRPDGGHRRDLQAALPVPRRRAGDRLGRHQHRRDQPDVGRADRRVQRQLRRQHARTRTSRGAALAAPAAVDARRGHEPADARAPGRPAHRLRERHRADEPQRRAARLLHALPDQRPGCPVGGQVGQAGGGRPAGRLRRHRAAGHRRTRRYDLVTPTGGTVSGTIEVRATAGDDRGVTGVRFTLDGDVLSDDTVSPYAIAEWHTTDVADGTHTLTATARDASGKTAPASATINVQNTDRQRPDREPDVAGGGLHASRAPSALTASATRRQRHPRRAVQGRRHEHRRARHVGAVLGSVAAASTSRTAPTR